MSRRSSTRHRRRKARRRDLRSGTLSRPASLPLRPEEHADVHGPVLWRDPRTRWTGLRTRSGRVLSFHPLGLRIPIDLARPDAAERFSEAVHAVLAHAPTVD